jgi:hypothetical protein
MGAPPPPTPPPRATVCYDLRRISFPTRSQSHIATDGQSISKSWCRAPSGAHHQIFITLWQLRSCFSRAPSPTTGRVSLLYMLLALASVVFLGSESRGTRDRIVLSQIWDFPFRRLLWLAGSRWRYSNPPPHGCVSKLLTVESRLLGIPVAVGTWRGPHRKHRITCCYHAGFTVLAFSRYATLY